MARCPAGRLHDMLSCRPERPVANGGRGTCCTTGSVGNAAGHAAGVSAPSLLGSPGTSSEKARDIPWRRPASASQGNGASFLQGRQMHRRKAAGRRIQTLRQAERQAGRQAAGRQAGGRQAGGRRKEAGRQKQGCRLRLLHCAFSTAPSPLRLLSAALIRFSGGRQAGDAQAAEAPRHEWASRHDDTTGLAS
jgi:hypothetical protein